MHCHKITILFYEHVSLARPFVVAGLDKYERAKVADSLDEIEFNDGDYVITIGDPGDTFYIVVEVHYFETFTIILLLRHSVYPGGAFYVVVDVCMCGLSL